MSVTTTSLLPAPVQQSFNEKLLAVPVPYMIHNVAATPVMMPRNGGTTLRQRRYDRLPVSNVPLGNSGAPIAPTVPTYVDIDAQMSFYGQWIGLNEQVTLGLELGCHCSERAA